MANDSYKIPRSLYSKAFIPVLKSKHRYLVCYGGRGSSKSHTLILKFILESFAPKHRAIYYCRKNFETIRSTTFKDFVFVIKMAGLTKYFDYSEVQNSSMVFTNRISGHKIMPYGLVEAEKTKGISQATHIFVDEITENTRESIDMIDSVLRTPQAEYLQFACAFNPVDENNFIRDYFFDKDNITLPRADYGDKLMVHHSTLEDNDYLDKQTYKESLMLKYSWNDNLLNINLFGLWGKAEVDKPYIPTFKKEIHVLKESLPYDNSDIYLSFDFNVDPITCIASQFRQDKLIIIEEFRLRNSDIFELCNQIGMKLPRRNFLKVTGDSTGKNRQAISKGGLTYYQIIQSELKIGQFSFIIPGMNHSIINSRAIVSRAFHGNKVLINPDCKYLINDLTYCEVNSDGKLLKKGTDKELTHLLDTLTYQIVNCSQVILGLNQK